MLLGVLLPGFRFVVIADKVLEFILHLLEERHDALVLGSKVIIIQEVEE